MQKSKAKHRALSTQGFRAAYPDSHAAMLSQSILRHLPQFWGIGVHQRYLYRIVPYLSSKLHLCRNYHPAILERAAANPIVRRFSNFGLLCHGAMVSIQRAECAISSFLCSLFGSRQYPVDCLDANQESGL